MSGVRMAIKNYKVLQKKLDDKKKAPKKAMKRLVADVKKRAPGWVAAEVVKTYGIKKSEITGKDKSVGRVSATGDDVKNVKIIYTGRPLTHTHFSMSPKVPKEGAYTLKATILKGQRTTLGKVKKLTKKQRAALAKNFRGEGTQNSDHSPIMLMRASGGHYLPFQRVSVNRKDIEAKKTLSLPQMVSSERTHDDIQNSLRVNVQKRMDHHMGKYM